MILRIANACGFWGDRIDAARRLVEAAEVDYLTLEYLAELTMSILARQRRRNPRAGYAADFVQVVESLAPALRAQPQLHVVTNAGGMNPRACAQAVAEVLDATGLDETIAVVEGDDLSGASLQSLAERSDGVNLETGETLRDLLGRASIVSANVYFGAGGIVDALNAGARIVITGRVADASLTVGPAVQRFGWNWDAWDRLAGATVAGHLIECGAQVTGGYSTEWAAVPDLAHVGYPIAELNEDGSCVIAKPAGAGGVVNCRTVVEQLIYEIGDPTRYLTPDVIADFTSVQVDDQGGDRVAVFGATGRPAPEDYKATLTYEDGFTASGQLLVHGRDCIAKARKCVDIILAQLPQNDLRSHVELLGAGDGVPGNVAHHPPEVMLRVAVHHRDKAVVERFARQFAPLITAGPAGLAGYAQGRPRAQPVLAHWPTLVSKNLMQPVVAVRTARQWLDDNLLA